MRFARSSATLLGVLFLLTVPMTFHYAWIRLRDTVLRRSASRRLDSVMAFQNGWGEIVLRVVEHGLKMKVEFDLPREVGGPYIVVLNHRSVMDIVLVHVFLSRMGCRLFTWVSKKENRYLLSLGQSAAFMGAAFLSRRASTWKDVDRIKDCARFAHACGTSVVVCPEGTRYVGPRKGYQNVRTPHVLGFRTLVTALPTYPILVLTVHWGESNTENLTGFVNAAKGLWGAHVRVHARVEENPGSQAAAEWLQATWQRMDRELIPTPSEVRTSTG